MRQPRPGVLTAAAVMAIIYGALATTCNLCGIVGLAAQGAMSQGFMAGDPQQAKVQKEMQDAIERDVPAYRVNQIAVVSVDLLLGILMLVAGIGLLGVRGWARLLALITALLQVLFSVFELIYNVVFVIPATSKAMADAMPGAVPQGAPPGAAEMMKTVQVFASIGMYASLGILVIVIVYLLVLMLLLMGRNARAAFAAAGAPEGAIAAGYPGSRADDEGWSASAPPNKPEDEWGIQREK